MNLDSALDAFSGGQAPGDRAHLAPLLATSGAAQAAKDPRFRAGLDRLVNAIRAEGERRVEALALAWRLTSVLSMREHRRHLVSELKMGLPKFDELPVGMADPDDRRHFGDAMSIIVEPWAADYLARSLVAEKDSEKAREALARALALRVPVVANQLALIRPVLLETRFEQHEPEVGRARRFAGIMDALTEVLWASEQETFPGSEFGPVLSGLVTEALVRRQLDDQNVAILAASSVMRFVIMMVRLHGTLAADARTYIFLGPLHRLFGTASWPDELRPLISRAASQIMEQLVFLVRLGMPDTELRRTYISLVGEVIAKLDFARAAEAQKGLDAEGARWLRTGTARRTLATQGAVEETAVAQIDRELALALRDAELLETGVSALSPDVIAGVEMLSPHLAEEVSLLLQRSSRLARQVQTVADRRNLVLRGQLGAVVPFSPIEHEPLPAAVGARTVMVVSRGVERVVDGRSLGIVLKSDVDRT